MPRVEIHDNSTQALIEILERAYAISYDLQSNAAPVASFSLPRDDPKWSAVQAFREVWLFNDLDELIDIFRIAPVQERRELNGTMATVQLEGFVCALQDDLVAAERIYTNQSVTAILTDLLTFQAVARVSIGTVDAALDKVISTRASFINVMRAAWETRNVVGGFMSVDAVGPAFTTRQLNLRADPGQDVGQRIYKGFNLRGLAKASETAGVFTKVWPLGRGEGRTQLIPSSDKLLAQPATLTLVGGSRSLLTFNDAFRRYKGWTALAGALPTGVDANDTRSRPMKIWRAAVDETANFEQGADERTLRSTTNNYNPGAGAWTIDFVHADYLIADAEKALYGTIGNAFVDKSLENSDALVRAAALYLDGVRAPRISHEVAVADLARVYTTESFERLHLHDKVNVFDPDLGITTKDRIVAARYGDMADPSSFTIVVSNLELADLEPRAVAIRDRVRKYEQQPDGATTLLGPDSFEDNVDATHAYTRNIEIPSDAVSVLSVKLRMRTKNYRYYVSAASTASAGASTSGQIQNTTNAATNNNSDGITDVASAHQHNISASHAHIYIGQHDHNIPGHGHSTTLTPGIIETTSPSAIEVKVDGTVASASATSLDDFDLTPYLTRNADGTIVRGLHTVTFTPNGNGRIQATIKGVVFLQSRGVIAG